MSHRRLRFCLLAFTMLLASCTPWPLESPEPADTSPKVGFVAPVSGGQLTYQGGDVVIRAEFSNFKGDTLDFSWRTGRAVVLGQGFLADSVEITAAWVKLRWDTTLAKDSGAKYSSDTIALMRHAQSMGAVVVTLENFLPRLDSIQAGSSLDSADLRSYGAIGDTVGLLTRPGAMAYMRLRFRDPDKNYPAKLRMKLPMNLGKGGTLRWRSSDPGDSILVWQAPDSLFDTCLSLVQTDGMGVGIRTWVLRLATYVEEGSVWVGQRTQLVKFARTADGKLLEIARLKGFGEVTGLAIDPIREGGLLLGSDRTKGTILKYTTEGLLRSTKSKVKKPYSMACDYDKGYCLAGEGDSTGRAWVTRIDGDTSTTSGLPGVPTSLVVAQGSWGRAWVAGRDSGYVGRISGKKLDTLLRGVFRKPSALAFDDSTGLLWVADLDSGTVTAIDSVYKKVTVIRGLRKPVSLSIRNGLLWVADVGDQSISRWRSGLLEKRFTGFTSPVAVAVDARNGRNAWALDEAMGRLMRFEGDSLVATTSGAGLDRPNLLVGHPGNQ